MLAGILAGGFSGDGTMAGSLGSFSGISLPKMNTLHKKQYDAGIKAKAASDTAAMKKQVAFLEKDAEKHFNKGNYTSAIALFQAAHDIMPRDFLLGREGEAWYQLAKKYEKGKDGANAFAAGVKSVQKFAYGASAAATAKSKPRQDHWQKRANETSLWLNSVDKTAKPPKKKSVTGKTLTTKDTEKEEPTDTGLGETGTNVAIIGVAALIAGVAAYLIFRKK
jgi:LPXTG-motif cell wall-anchored protein